MAPLNSTRATHQQQLPGMSGLVLNSMSSSPSAWVWFQTPRLATSAGRLSIEPMTTRCRNTLASILEQADFDWRQACTTEADFTSSTQSCHCILAFLVQVSGTHSGTLGGRVSMLGLLSRLCAVLQNAEN